MFQVQKIRKDFPIYSHIPELVYLDSSATSLKPQSVIDKETEYYSQYSANIFRGIYDLSERATVEYERTREIVANFINAKSSHEIIFTRNTTESLNLIAYSFGRQIVDENSEVVVTVMEHHSNFVPWQQLAFENGAVFKVINVDRQGHLNTDNLNEVINSKTKIFSMTYISNVLGMVNPVKEILQKVKKINPQIITIIDAAQAAPHISIDVQDLGCDFLAFSSHKMLGPTGVGVLWGKLNLLREMYPFQYGGEMIREVSIEKTTFEEPPAKFEAGTPHIAGVIALQTAINYLKSIGLQNIEDHEKELVNYAFKSLRQAFEDSVYVLGPQSKNRSGIIAFTIKGLHPHDMAQVLNDNHVAIRAGHHCAMPLHTYLGIPASSRMSFYIYNDKQDIDKAIYALKEAFMMLRKT